MKNFLIYGSYGYTGQLIVARALKEGLRPILAGRNEKKLRAQAEQTNLDCRAFSLNDTAKLDAALLEVDAVLHCAGPFVHTFHQMAEACLRTKRHYVDISGEIIGFEALARMSEQAKAAGIMLLPGAGFDVVPSDCLAAHLKQRLPSATSLAGISDTRSGITWYSQYSDRACGTRRDGAPRRHAGGGAS